MAERLVFIEDEGPKKDPTTGMPYLSVYGIGEVARIWGNGRGPSRLFARKLVASDDMLAALKEIVRLADTPITSVDEIHRAYDAARAAISRAENGDTDATT